MKKNHVADYRQQKGRNGIRGFLAKKSEVN
jgi:hypothetical protein